MGNPGVHTPAAFVSSMPLPEIDARAAPKALLGPRVCLRHPTREDSVAYVAVRDASMAFLGPWEPTNPAHPQDPPLPSTVAFERLLATCNLDHSQRFLVVRREGEHVHREGEQVLGQLSINHISRGPFLNGVIGYWIGAAFAHQGFMSEALMIAARYALGPLGLHRVEANIVPTNARSIGLVKKLGFRYEGTALRYLHIGGAWRDHERWAMTVEDLEAMDAGALKRRPSLRASEDTIRSRDERARRARTVRGLGGAEAASQVRAENKSRAKSEKTPRHASGVHAPPVQGQMQQRPRRTPKPQGGGGTVTRQAPAKSTKQATKQVPVKATKRVVKKALKPAGEPAKPSMNARKPAGETIRAAARPSHPSTARLKGREPRPHPRPRNERRR